MELNSDMEAIWTQLQENLCHSNAHNSTTILRHAFKVIQTNNFGVCKMALHNVIISSNDIETCTHTLTQVLREFWTDVSSPIAYMILMVVELLQQNESDAICRDREGFDQEKNQFSIMCIDGIQGNLDVVCDYNI